MQAHRHQAVMFDLDGTLLDSLADLASAMNHALEALGFPPHPLEAYKAMVGDGVEALCQRALPPHADAMLQEVRAKMQTHYAQHCTHQTRPYPGIKQLIEALHTRGFVLAVLSNKADSFTNRLVEHYFGAGSFHCIRGHCDTARLKPDPSVALDLATKLQVSPRDWLYLGDTNTDMETAVRSGMTAVGVLWGFRGAEELKKAGAQHLVATPADVLELV